MASSRCGAEHLGSLQHGRDGSLYLKDVNSLSPLALLDREHQPSGTGCYGSGVASVSSLNLSTIALCYMLLLVVPSGQPGKNSTAAPTLQWDTLVPPQQEEPPVSAGISTGFAPHLHLCMLEGLTLESLQTSKATSAADFID